VIFLALLVSDQLIYNAINVLLIMELIIFYLMVQLNVWTDVLMDNMIISPVINVLFVIVIVKHVIVPPTFVSAVLWWAVYMFTCLIICAFKYAQHFTMVKHLITLA
jgi:hypothetical protein